MKAHFGKKTPAAAPQTGFQPHGQSNLLHDFYELHLKNLMLTQAKRKSHLVEGGPSPDMLQKSTHEIHITKLCLTDSAMEMFDLGNDLFFYREKRRTLKDLQASVRLHIQRRAQLYADAIAKAATCGVQLLHPYALQYDPRFHSCHEGKTPTATPAGDHRTAEAIAASATGIQPGQWRVSEEEWNYAFTALWAFYTSWHLPFFPEEAIGTVDPYFGNEKSEMGKVIQERRRVLRTPEFSEAERTAYKRANPHKRLTPYRVRAALFHGLRGSYVNPAGTFFGFSAGEPSTAELANLAHNPIFRKPVEDEKKKKANVVVPEVFLCEIAFANRSTRDQKIALVALDLRAATFFDPETGMFGQKDGDRDQLLEFFFRIWIKHFHMSYLPIQIAFYSRPPR